MSNVLEEEHMLKRKSTRRKNNMRRKRKKLFATLAFFAFLIASSAVYGFYNQFESARLASREKIKESGNLEQLSNEKIEFNADVVNNEKIINVLLIGIDERKNEPSRTDTIIIAQYRPKEGTAKIASIMRDSYVSIPGYKNNKINTSFFLGGPELLRQTIKENFGIDIHYYAMVNFDGFVQVVDHLAPEGIEVNVANRMYYQSSEGTIDFQPGLQTINGEQALNYVRFRSDKDNNDFGRVRRQQEVLSILKEQLTSISGLARLPATIGSVEPYIHTNMTSSKIIGLGKDFLVKPVKHIDTLTIPIENSYEDKSYRHAGLVLDLNIEKNKQALQQFFEGTDEEKVVYEGK